MLFKKTNSQKLNSYKTQYGIRLSRNNKFQQFEAKNIQELTIWQSQLKKYIHQYNFHHIFSPIEKIGSGNYAFVYLAKNNYSKQNYAIKSFVKQYAYQDLHGKQCIENQIKILRLFNHPSIVKIQGVYTSQKSIYIAMQYVKGKSLKIKKDKTIYQHKQRKQIIRNILRGLCQLSRKNVIHRDLKPQNIIIGNQTVIIDFGLATLANEQKYLFYRCGTPGYIAPQILNIKDNQYQKCYPISDMFSIGCIFYELIFNEKLFKSNKYSQLIELNRNCQIKISGYEFEKLDKLEIDLLKKMLEKLPQFRITCQSALSHAYFGQNIYQTYIPKLLMKQNGSCPIQMIGIEGQVNAKFIDVEKKKTNNNNPQINLNQTNQVFHLTL